MRVQPSSLQEVTTIHGVTSSHTTSLCTKDLTSNIAAVQIKYLHHTALTNGGSACGSRWQQSELLTSSFHRTMYSKTGSSSMLSSCLTRSPRPEWAIILLFLTLGCRASNHWSHPFNGRTGTPALIIIRNGVVVSDATVSLITASTTLSNGCTNYNAWVGLFEVLGTFFPELCEF